MKHSLWKIVICLVAILALIETNSESLSLKVNAQKAEPIVKESAAVITIKGDSEYLRAEIPFFLSTTIENKTKEKLPLKENSSIGLVLKPTGKVDEDVDNYSYSGMFYLFETNKNLYSKIIEKEELEPAGEYSFSTDVPYLRWGRSNPSFSPYDKISTVTKGDYELYLSIEVRETKNSPRKVLFSNRIKLTIE